LKRKISVGLIVIIILVLGGFCAQNYINSEITYKTFLKNVEDKGYHIKDITKQQKKLYGTLPSNYKFFQINEEIIWVIIGKSYNIDSIRKKLVSNYSYKYINSAGNQIDYGSIIRVYGKGYVLVQYGGIDEKLLKTLKELLGENINYVPDA
jgi:hypothetical protein